VLRPNKRGKREIERSITKEGEREKQNMGLCFGCFDGGNKRMTKEEERLASEEARARAAEVAQKKYVSLIIFSSSSSSSFLDFYMYEKPCCNLVLFFVLHVIILFVSLYIYLLMFLYHKHCIHFFKSCINL